MKGFLKMLAADFAAWNTAATTTANANGVECESYTSSTPDTDANYVWARVEPWDENPDGALYVENAEDRHFYGLDIKTEAEAVADGMVIPVAEV